MKRKIMIPLILALLLILLPMDTYASEHIIDKGDGLFWIDASVDEPYDYMQITGFELTYRLIRGGQLGEPDDPFPVNALMIASGACDASDFEMDYEGSIPQYVGNARELITHTTGDGSFVGTMFFDGGVDAGPLAVGETVTVTYDGNQALFGETDSFMSAYTLFDAEFEIVDVAWVFGDIEEMLDVELTWEPVQTIQFMDIPTVGNGTDYNYIDISVPKGQGPYPVVFWIHGGGWSMLDRTSFFIRTTREYLLYSGFAVVSAEYTLSVHDGDDITSGYPQMIYDLKAAVRYIRANSGRYNLDTDYIIAMGESAGGHLAMLMGTTNGSPEHEDLSMGNADFSSDVQAMVSYFGPSDFVDNIMGAVLLGNSYTDELAKLASPYHQIDANAPPLFLTHGENDDAVPISHSYAIEQRAIELLGSENVTTLYREDGPHASRAAFDTAETMEAVVAFINRHMAAVPAVAFDAISEASSDSDDVLYDETNDVDFINEEVADAPLSTIIYVIIAIVGAAIIGGVIFLLIRKKKGQEDA